MTPIEQCLMAVKSRYKDHELWEVFASHLHEMERKMIIDAWQSGFYHGRNNKKAHYSDANNYLKNIKDDNRTA